MTQTTLPVKIVTEYIFGIKNILKLLMQFKFSLKQKFEVYYYNFELEDYSVASTLKMLDMVKVLAFAVTEGKVNKYFPSILFF